jgi:hypothetical protein
LNARARFVAESFLTPVSNWSCGMNYLDADKIVQFD